MHGTGASGKNAFFRWNLHLFPAEKLEFFQNASGFLARLMSSVLFFVKKALNVVHQHFPHTLHQFRRKFCTRHDFCYSFPALEFNAGTLYCSINQKNGILRTAQRRNTAADQQREACKFFLRVERHLQQQILHKF